MTLELKEWKKILDTVNRDKGNIFEQIKEGLKKNYSEIYQKWKEKDFNVDHLFDAFFYITSIQISLELTLLHIAAFNGHLDTVKYLVDDKNVSLDQKTNDDRTALHLAAFNGQLDIVKYLVHEKNVSLDQKTNYGITALHWAALNGHLDTVKYLVDEKNVSLDQKDNDGRTALHWAALNGQLDIVKYLVDEKNVSLDQKDNDGKTALHWAALEGRKDVVTALLSKGANPLIKNKDGKTPRELANDENIIQLLKEAETKQVISKAMITGSVCGVIAALTVGIGCGVIGIELSILAIAGIAVAAALVIGVIAGCITYSVSKPSDKLDKPDLEVANQQVNGVS